MDALWPPLLGGLIALVAAGLGITHSTVMKRFERIESEKDAERDRRHSEGDRLNNLVGATQIDARTALTKLEDIEPRIERLERKVLNGDR